MAKHITLDVGRPIFENRLLDLLTRIHPIVPILMWVPVAVGSLVWGVVLLTSPEVGQHWAHAFWLVPVGVLGWTLAEYLLHRYFFHFLPKREPWHSLFYHVHMYHHDYIERDRLLAPPMMSIPIFVGLTTGFYFAFTLPLGVWTGLAFLLPYMCGFLFGYLGYDYIHYATHFIVPRSRFLKVARKRHLQHHYAYPKSWYGISCHIWDFVFFTHVRKGMKPHRAGRGESPIDGGPEADAPTDFAKDETVPAHVRDVEQGVEIPGGTVQVFGTTTESEKTDTNDVSREAKPSADATDDETVPSPSKETELAGSA